MAEEARATDRRVTDLSERSKKLAAAMEGEVSRLRADLESLAAASLGAATLPAPPPKAGALAAQLADLEVALDAKAGQTAVDEARRLGEQVCFASIHSGSRCLTRLGRAAP